MLIPTLVGAWRQRYGHWKCAVWFPSCATCSSAPGTEVLGNVSSPRSQWSPAPRWRPRWRRCVWRLHWYHLPRWGWSEWSRQDLWGLTSSLWTWVTVSFIRTAHTIEIHAHATLNCERYSPHMRGATRTHNEQHKQKHTSINQKTQTDWNITKLKYPHKSDNIQ